MILLPLPITMALILGFLALRMARVQRPVPMLALLLAFVALQAVIIGFSLHYALPFARFLQPVTAMALPAMAWLAWQVDGLGQRLDWRDMSHAIGPMVALALRFENAALLDVLVPLGYAGYGAALALSVLRTGPDVPRARMGQGDQPRLIWAGIAAALGLSALTDLAIAALIVLGHGDAVPLMVDLATSAQLLGLGLLAVSAQNMTGPAGEDDFTAPSDPSEDDRALFARLETLMAERKLWRDPDVTLSMLARRLHVPVKAVSIAVNRVTGQNISRYINQYRIDAAIGALQSGDSVTEAMLKAGFVTKSNFNREFRRITGQAPSIFCQNIPNRSD
jgi:AraC-like DNA-binding protein